MVEAVAGLTQQDLLCRHVDQLMTEWEQPAFKLLMLLPWQQIPTAENSACVCVCFHHEIFKTSDCKQIHTMMQGFPLLSDFRTLEDAYFKDSEVQLMISGVPDNCVLDGAL